MRGEEFLEATNERCDILGCSFQVSLVLCIGYPIFSTLKIKPWCEIFGEKTIIIVH